MKRFFLYGLLGCFIASCSTKKSELFADADSFDFSDFRKMTELTSEELDLDTLDIVPLQIEVFGDVLISRNQADEKLFTVIDVVKKQKIADKINVGQGPEDMLYPAFAGSDDKYIYISDAQTSCVNTYLIEDFLSAERLQSIGKVSLEKRVIGEAKRLRDGYIGSIYNTDFSHYVFGEKGELVDSIGPYPQIMNQELTTMEKLDTYMNKIATNGKDRIAICYLSTDMIDFYDNKLNLIERLNGPVHFITKVKEWTDGRVTMARISGPSWDAFMCPKNVDNELWVLFSGKNSKNPDYEYSYHYILTFSWDGHPKQAFHLDHGIIDFSVDTQKKIIYAVTEKPDVHIIKFNY